MPVNRWKHTLHLGEVFHNDDLTFEEGRDAIVGRIKAAPFYDANDFVLEDLVDQLGHAETTAAFDDYWGDFYDWADDERVWIETTAVRS